MLNSRPAQNRYGRLSGPHMAAPSLLERAFALAKAGECRTIGDLRRVLQSEGYVVRDLEGPALLKQLRDLMRDAQQQDRSPESSARNHCQGSEFLLDDF